MSQLRTPISASLMMFFAAATASCAPPTAPDTQPNRNGNVNATAGSNSDSTTPPGNAMPDADTSASNDIADTATTGDKTKGAGGMNGVDFTPRITTVERAGQKRIRVEYKVTNRTGKPLLVFNQGDTDNPGEDGAIYVEAGSDGVVEISQRAWEPPTDPSPTQVVYPGATLLAPGASASKSFELTVAYLVARRPYGSMTPGAAMPRPVRKIRFCLGVAPAEGVQTRTEGEGARRILVPDYKGIVSQRLLCSPVQDIK